MLSGSVHGSESEKSLVNESTLLFLSICALLKIICRDEISQKKKNVFLVWIMQGSWEFVFLNSHVYTEWYLKVSKSVNRCLPLFAVDDIAFKKKEMHSGWWGLSRVTISLLDLRQNHFSGGIFSNVNMHYKKLKYDFRLMEDTFYTYFFWIFLLPLFTAILGKSHYLLYALVPAMQPRMLVTLDTDLKPLPVHVRLGQVSVVIWKKRSRLGQCVWVTIPKDTDNQE